MKRLKIIAMIAAAGNSTRVGHHKALMNIFGRPAIYYSLEKLACIKPQKLFVTLPHALIIDSGFRTVLKDFPTSIRPNSYPKLGYAGSIKTVLMEDHLDVDGIIISPVDSPIFSKDLVITIVQLATMLKRKPAIVVPHFYSQPGHPIYFSRDFFDSLKQCGHAGGPRAVIKNNKRCAHALGWPDARILSNLNCRNDWHITELDQSLHSHQYQRPYQKYQFEPHQALAPRDELAFSIEGP